ncbi:MAG: cytochrome c-type biogenesis protein CcmE [Paracoccaceae bacterium]|nr:MAG: cytochrome c-type biogenesis protein CcmE [Paracoccaceae bacterium]
MAGLRKKRRMRLIVAGLVLLAAAAALVGYAMRDGIEFFRSPSQVVEAPPPPGERFRLGGLVEEGSVVRGQGETVSFRITDGANSIAVTHVGVLPDLFAEGQGVIVTGHLRAGVFEATEVLAKHDEKYMPREVADALKEQGVYRGD